MKTHLFTHKKKTYNTGVAEKFSFCTFQRQGNNFRVKRNRVYQQKQEKICHNCFEKKHIEPYTKKINSSKIGEKKREKFGEKK